MFTKWEIVRIAACLVIAGLIVFNHFTTEDAAIAFARGFLVCGLIWNVHITIIEAFDRRNAKLRQELETELERFFRLHGIDR